MTVIRKNQRDERRRRALVDEAKSNSDDSSPRPSTGRKTSVQSSYANAALVCNQPRITDLIPVRVFSVWVLLLIGLTVCCLNATAGLVYYDRLQMRFPELQRLFEPSVPGSFSSWNSGIFLLFATLIAVLTLWIRRHRIDDYRGRYRIWFFIPVFLAVTSIDAVVKITKISMFDSAEIQLGFATAKISHLLICFFGIAVGVRLLLEIRPSKAATTLLLMASASYLLSFLVSWRAFAVVAGLSDFVSSVTMLTGHWLLTMCLLANLRYIFLDSQGEIAAIQTRKSQRKIELKKAKEAAAQAKAEATKEKEVAAQAKAAALAAKKAKSSKVEEPTAPDVVPMKKQTVPVQKQEKPAVAAKTAPQSKSARPAEPISDDADAPDQADHAMSRADRKRLRKEKKKNRRAA